MKRLTFLPFYLLALVLGLSTARASDGKLPLHFSTSFEGAPTKQFESDVPKVFAVWRGADVLKVGDKVRAVWIAEDVGTRAPANTRIDEYSGTVAKDGADGFTSLSKPTAGWPEGTYRVEVYVNEKLIATKHFTIGKAGAPAAKGEKKAKDDEDDDE